MVLIPRYFHSEDSNFTFRLFKISLKMGSVDLFLEATVIMNSRVPQLYSHTVFTQMEAKLDL